MAISAVVRSTWKVSRYSDFGAATHKVALTNTDPTAQTNISGVTQVTGDGYTSGGTVLPFSDPAWDGSDARVEVKGSDDVVFTGPISASRYYVLYRVSDGAIVAHYDDGQSLTLNSASDTKTFSSDGVDIVRNA